MNNKDSVSTSNASAAPTLALSVLIFFSQSLNPKNTFGQHHHYRAVQGLVDQKVYEMSVHL